MKQAKKQRLPGNIPGLFLLLFFITVLNGCAVVEGIFKAGVWTGILIIAAIIFLVIFLIARASRKS